MKPDARDGGYEAGYKACPLFWGENPGSLVTKLAREIDFDGLSVLDIGGGEGKNAAYLAALGATVEVWDVSETAIQNGQAIWPNPRIKWKIRDAVDLAVTATEYDVIVAYGLLHCLHEEEIAPLVEQIMRHTKVGGHNVVVTFNDRSQNIAEAHPDFSPTLLPHDYFLSLYSGWDVSFSSDTNLVESHPHNEIEHVHSMTRLIATRPF